MLDKFNKLNIYWKIAIGIGLFLVALWIYDFSTGGVRDVKNWMFDAKQAKIEETIKKLESSNEELRKENIALVANAEKLEIRSKALDAQIESLGGKIEANTQATDKALEEVYKEEAETALPTDAKARCERLKVKLIKLNIKSAGDMNCEEFN